MLLSIAELLIQYLPFAMIFLLLLAFLRDLADIKVPTTNTLLILLIASNVVLLAALVLYAFN